MASGAAFVSGSYLPRELFYRITDVRVHEPERIQAAAECRRRRPRLAPDGRLVLLAADHPARNVTRVGDNPLAMGDRHAYLERIVRVLTHSEIDGVMATPDILDELFALDSMIREVGGAGFLDGKVLIGCMNRGGLAGANWELDDFLTGYTPQAIVRQRLDGAKMMFRLSLDDRDSARTLQYCAQWITELNGLGIPSFVEALPVVRENDTWRMRLDPEDLVRVVGIATALGDSSSRLWLKLPYVDGFEQVVRATTCPILILGGESHGKPLRVLADLAGAMAAGPNVRGVLIGRNVIWPGDDDPRAVAVAVARVVRGLTPETAAEGMAALRGQGMDELVALFGRGHGS